MDYLQRNFLKEKFSFDRKRKVDLQSLKFAVKFIGRLADCHRCMVVSKLLGFRTLQLSIHNRQLVEIRG